MKSKGIKKNANLLYKSYQFLLTNLSAIFVPIGFPAIRMITEQVSCDLTTSPSSVPSRYLRNKNLQLNHAKQNISARPFHSDVLILFPISLFFSYFGSNGINLPNQLFLLGFMDINTNKTTFFLCIFVQGQ